VPTEQTKVTVLFGGPGVEHNISASTLKPWVTTLYDAGDIDLRVYFLRAAEPIADSSSGLYSYPEVEWWNLPKKFLYANTCEDFSSRGQLNEAGSSPNQPDHQAALADATIVSLVHGMYGEDGVLAQNLRNLMGAGYAERVLLPAPCALHQTFDKMQSYEELRKVGLTRMWSFWPTAVPIPISVYREQTPFPSSSHRSDTELNLLADRVYETACELVPRNEDQIVLKPARGGSSFGVSIVSMNAIRETECRALWEPLRRIIAVTDNLPFDKTCDYCGADLKESRLVIEPYHGGKDIQEFSVITLGRDLDGLPLTQPIALSPTGITSPSGHVFDTRQKGLYGAGTRLDTPARLRKSLIDYIREAAAKTHEHFALDVMARVDGFVKTNAGDDEVTITDVNPIAGMTSASFTFLQATHVGLNHESFVRYLLRSKTSSDQIVLVPLHDDITSEHKVRTVNVVLGGATSERDVSRQSGFFAGLCLAAGGFQTSYTLLDRSGSFTPIGLFYALHHQVDQIENLIDDSLHSHRTLNLSDNIMDTLDPRATHKSLRDLRDEYLRIGTNEGKKHLTLRELLLSLPADKSQDATLPLFVLLALHGGMGEDGTMQTALELFGIPYNGSGPKASALCADKNLASRSVQDADIHGVRSVPSIPVTRMEMYEILRDSARLFFSKNVSVWRIAGLDPRGLVLKPNSDGCSTGVSICRDEAEFESAVLSVLRLSPRDVDTAVAARASATPDSMWLIQPALIDEPTPLNVSRDRDSLRVWFRDRRYVELTVGVLEASREAHSDPPFRAGLLRGLEPSVTVSKGNFLTLEEKFQQGLGENIPLRSFEVADQTVESITRRARDIALALGVEGYARIDFIYDRINDHLYFLEANTLCALTDATVFYSQAYDRLQLSPVNVMRSIVDAGVRRHEIFRLQ
jgi:D-alanine-D-alanine ligase-like ATP-grasp enzyme